MSSATRVFRPTAPPPGRPQSGLGTVVFGAPPPPSTTARDAWLRIHRLVRSACLEEARPGAFVFVTTASGQLAGRLWLAATATPRTATLGRHERVDLPLAPDAALSLRHLLFITRLVSGRVRCTVVDLESRAGVHTEAGAQRVLDADRAAVFRASGLWLFCIPTGPSTVLPAEPQVAWQGLQRDGHSAQPSLVDRFLAGQLRPAGTLDVSTGGEVSRLPLDESTLERGLLIGREARCHLVVAHTEVSRVHAVLLLIDGAPHLVDAGSSNGLWTPAGERVRCVKLERGATLLIGPAQLRWTGEA